MAWLFAGLSLLAACGDDGGREESDSGTELEPVQSASCDPVGKMAACTGRGGCAGTQVCQADNRYGACTCNGGVPGVDGGVVAPGGDGTACGQACTSDTECGNGTCVEPIEGTGEVEGLGPLPVTLFPGGLCSQTPLASFTSAAACDPTAVGAAQGCGSCAVCVPEFLGDQIATVCREKCTPSAAESGCSRPEYTCSFGLGACVEGCASDEECRVYNDDSDGDGAADTSVYDAASQARCNPATRRCQVAGKPGALAGDPCMRHDDCEADGLCLTESGTDFELPFVGGYCTKTGCDVPGLACAGTGTVCTEPRVWSAVDQLGTVCARACQLGAEPADAQLGAAGHGDSCRAGYMCMWNGTANDPSGTCLPGNYNAVAANNVGAVCTEHAECFSPFGHGRCLTIGAVASTDGVDAPSFCSILDCDVAGLPADVCGAGNTCLPIGEDLTACAKVCQDGTGCAAGLACVATGATTPKICAFGCSDASECRPGETCSRAGECLSP